ncbi:hypothetical protein OF83DRAFT_413138 [Amylostereum chailletii]|nr:hypothetical protein OF83DRAFT_413138 [Amylostereum chailletii]
MSAVVGLLQPETASDSVLRDPRGFFPIVASLLAFSSTPTVYQMATELSALRAELKSFERSFKEEHGHAPSTQDIKTAGFADRYKLYKKLSKAEKPSAFPLPPSNSATRSSTPPPAPSTSHSPTFILPKSRAVKTQTVSSSNPFSPVKDKTKPSVHLTSQPKLPNPFATPTKPKPTSTPRPSSRLISPDPFPPLTFSNGAGPSDSRPPAQLNNPVSRARKRLRGEPVSPSPVKEKRQRTETDTVIPFPQLDALTAGDSDDENFRDAQHANSSFVADSPMKVPPKGAAFKILFEDSQPSTLPLPKPDFSRSKASSTSGTLLRSRSQRARSMSRSSDDLPEYSRSEMKPGASTKEQRPKLKKEKTRNVRVNGFSFGKNDLFASVDSAEDPSKKLRTAANGNASHPRTSTKRRLSDAADPEDAGQSQTNAHLPLLPPSPPPAGSSSYKGKAKVTGGRKKAKVSADNEDDEDEEESSEGGQITVREWTFQRHGQDGSATNASDVDSDPILGLGTHDRQRTASTPGLGSDDEPGDFEVNLPDELRRMLALSPSKARDAEETGTVQGVLYGIRTKHYDGEKGGDIWDAGEYGNELEVEDDWEGEPVPWEVGEM